MTAVDGADLSSLSVVTLEWLAIGWLSGVAWPEAAPWGPRWALRAIVGATLIGFSLLLLGLLGISFAWPPLSLAVAAVAATVIRRLQGAGHARSSRVPRHPAERTARYSAASRIGWGLLGGVLLASVVRAVLVPESGWDAFSHWGLKAEAFFRTGAIVDTHTAHEYYPPLVPLLESWIEVQRGAASIDLAKTIWAVLGAAFSVCLAWHVRLALGDRNSWVAPMLALAIILGTPHFLESFWTGEADLALTVYLSLAVFALSRWCDEPQRAWLAQAMVFGAAATAAKYEGVFRVCVVLVALGLELALRRQIARVALTACVAATSGLTYAAWAVFRSAHGIQVSTEHLSHFQLEAIGSVLVALGGALGGVRTGGGLAVAVLASVFAGAKMLAPPLRFLTFVVIGQLTTTILAFLLTDGSPVVQVQDSATRLFEQFAPILLFAAAIRLVDSLRLGIDQSAPSHAFLQTHGHAA